jgi:hypothetical protein
MGGTRISEHGELNFMVMVMDRASKKAKWKDCG